MRLARFYCVLLAGGLLSASCFAATSDTETDRKKTDATVVTELPETPSPAPMHLLHNGKRDAIMPPPYVLPNGNRLSYWANTVPEGVAVTPYTVREKEIFTLHQMFRPKLLIAATLSAGFEHGLNLPPHYGTNSEAFAQRFGSAVASAETQTIAMDAIIAPLLHEDPRYFQLGPGHSYLQRAIWAAKNVVLTRGDDNDPAVNLPKLGGYAVVDVVKYTTYYPDRDRQASLSLTGYITSLSGALLGYEVEEFYPDLWHAVKRVSGKKDKNWNNGQGSRGK